MSIEAIAAAIRIKTGDPAAKHVLIMLANRHNADTGHCIPSISTIAAECEMSVETVRRKLAYLVGQCLIRVVPRERENGSRTSNQYELMFMRPPPQSEGVPPLNLRGPPPQSEGAITASITNTHTHTRARARAGDAQKILPTEEWRPSDDDIEAIRREFPRATDEQIEQTIRSFIDWTNAKNIGYVRLGPAWRNSARRDLANPAASFRHPSGPGAAGRQSGSALAGAIRRFAGEG